MSETTTADPRDDVIAAVRALVAAWHVDYPAGTDPEAVIGLREGELDAALSRLDEWLYDGHAEPEATTAVAADHWQPTGRPVSAPPAEPEPCDVCGGEERTYRVGQWWPCEACVPARRGPSGGAR